MKPKTSIKGKRPLAKKSAVTTDYEKRLREVNEKLPGVRRCFLPKTIIGGRGMSVCLLSSNSCIVVQTSYQVFSLKPMNSWFEPTYFLGAFPDLFPYSTGGHYQPGKSLRMIPVSLEEFAKWAMTHHSHRFARHPIFPYVLYDIARKYYWEKAQADILAISSKDLRAAALRMSNGEKSGNPAIERLLSNMRLISSYNPESYGRKVAKRHLLFDHIVRYAIPAIWFTINPSDVKNPVILRIAQVKQPSPDPYYWESDNRRAVFPLYHRILF
jgi:helitron helicase-like protein